MVKITGKSTESDDLITKLSKQKHCNLVSIGKNSMGDIKNIIIHERSKLFEFETLKKTSTVSLDVKYTLSCKHSKSIWLKELTFVKKLISIILEYIWDQELDVIKQASRTCSIDGTVKIK